MKPNRAMKRKRMKDLGHEDRYRAELDRQRNLRHEAARKKMQAHAEPLRLKHVPKWAQYLSRNVAPAWYLNMWRFIIGLLPPVFIYKLAPKNAFTSLFYLPFEVVALILSFIFVKPIVVLRRMFFFWGFKVKYEKLSEFVEKQVITVGGKVIDDTKWEA